MIPLNPVVNPVTFKTFQFIKMIDSHKKIQMIFRPNILILLNTIRLNNVTIIKNIYKD